jgi:hypothetical protein
VEEEIRGDGKQQREREAVRQPAAEPHRGG